MHHLESSTKIEYPNGSVIWKNQSGEVHLHDGPALITAGKIEFWIIEGKTHREDGPAVIHPDGTINWYLNDLPYEFDDWCKELKLSDEGTLFLRLKYA